VRGTGEGTRKVFFLGTDLFILRRTSSEKKQYPIQFPFVVYSLYYMFVV